MTKSVTVLSLIFIFKYFASRIIIFPLCSKCSFALFSSTMSIKFTNFIIYFEFSLLIF